MGGWGVAGGEEAVVVACNWVDDVGGGLLHVFAAVCGWCWL